MTAPTDLYRRARRYWETVRYLRPQQLASRVSLRTTAVIRAAQPGASRRWYASRAARAALTFVPDPWHLEPTPAATQLLVQGAAADAARDAAAARRGAFTFLNETRELGRPVDWQALQARQLWRYHLHYFDYLAEFTVAHARSDATALILDWIAHVPFAERATRDAWHPYVVSLRIVNWMLFLASPQEDVPTSSAILDSLRIQTTFLLRNLETDVGGNHLLKNLKALAIAGSFWAGAGADRLRRQFTDRFVRELRNQLRSDGGHYEQSPMYHAQVLGDAIELAMVLRRRGERNLALDAAIGVMNGFLARVCHPDGELAQFGDTAAGMTPAPAALADAAGVLDGRRPAYGLAPRHALLAAGLVAGRQQGDATPPAAAPAADQERTWDPGASGFITLATADGRGFLIADAGPVCPDDLPAHAHADLFGFEISVDATRIVVDSGVSEYAAGPWRDYYRSTRAHSTVMVDGEEQSECWGSFRVGRRARVVAGQFEGARIAPGFSAEHTGFDHLSEPVRHRRRFALVAGTFWVIIDDLRGSGTHEWTTFLHLHPDVTLTPGRDGLVATRSGATLGMAWFGMGAPRCASGEHEPLQGWYAPAFGRALASPTLIAHGSGALPCRFGWVLVPGFSPNDTLAVDETGPDSLAVRIGGERHEIAGVSRAAKGTER